MNEISLVSGSDARPAASPDNFATSASDYRCKTRRNRSAMGLPDNGVGSLTGAAFMIAWTTAAPAVSAAFLGSLVEAVEALTIVLAVATVRGWRPAGLGALAGLGSLALIVPAA